MIPSAAFPRLPSPRLPSLPPRVAVLLLAPLRRLRSGRTDPVVEPAPRRKAVGWLKEVVEGVVLVEWELEDEEVELKCSPDASNRKGERASPVVGMPLVFAIIEATAGAFDRRPSLGGSECLLGAGDTTAACGCKC